MAKSIMICAGIDTGKQRLDVAVSGSLQRLQVDNGAAGQAVLSVWLHEQQVERVGIEASGGCEAAVVGQLRRDGFVVVLFQPARWRAAPALTRPERCATSARH
jgi:transposase